jgi:hypothetical protein
MKRQARKLVVMFATMIAILLLAITVFAGEEKNEANEKEISLKDAPPAVQSTIEKQAAGKEIKEIEIKTKDGKEIYVVDVGTEKDFMVSSDGKFLGFEEEEESEAGEKGEKGEKGKKDENEIPLNQVPEQVKEAATKYLGSLESCEVKKEIEKDVTIYEVKIEKEEKETSAEFTEAGEILELEKEIQPSKLPESVISKIKAEYPGTKIKEATEKQKFEKGVAKGELSYEVEVVLKKEIEITATGQIIPQDDEEKTEKDDEEDDD